MELRYPRKENGMFILSKGDFDGIAGSILRLYQPSALDTAKPVDIDELAGEHLCLNVMSRAMAFNDMVLGLTAFSDVSIPCYDEQYNKMSVDLVEGDVLIHSALSGRSERYRRRFTLAHEAAHWVLHRTYHSPTNQQYQFRTQREISPFIACRSETIESKRYALKTDLDWEEWQADNLGAAFLMPYITFVREANRCVCKGGRRFFSQGEYSQEYIEIREELSEMFAVSKTAVEIRLKQLGFIRGEREYTYA